MSLAILTARLSAGPWEPLFNGRDLTGWRTINGTAPFTVVAGAIVGTTVVGSPNSFLATDKTYGDFIFECEVKQLGGRSNSGIQFRGVSEAAAENGRVRGYQLEIDPAMQTQSALNKKIAFELVFKSPQLQQLDYKADFILTRLFQVLEKRYIEGKDSLHLMPGTVEAEIAKAPDAITRARLVCDWVASMTDNFAFRTYRRLFDADFGSITDFV